MNIVMTLDVCSYIGPPKLVPVHNANNKSDIIKNMIHILCSLPTQKHSISLSCSSAFTFLDVTTLWFSSNRSYNILLATFICIAKPQVFVCSYKIVNLISIS